MKRLCSAVLAAALLAGGVGVAQEPVSMHVEAPELVGVTGWVNTKPLKLSDLKGRVVVLHFWTFG